jgi:hypothetical protein
MEWKGSGDWTLEGGMNCGKFWWRMKGGILLFEYNVREVPKGKGRRTVGTGGKRKRNGYWAEAAVTIQCTILC